MNRIVFEFGYLIGLARIAWHTKTPSPVLDMALKAGWIKPGERVLEVGCGLGTNSEWLASHEFDVTGIDLSVVAARSTRRHLTRRGLRAKIYQADLFYGLSEAPFDVVFDRATLHSFPKGVMRRNFARCLADNVKPGGSLILTEMRPVPKMAGRKLPPFGIDLADLQELFGPDFEIASVGEEHQHHRVLGPLPFGQWRLRRLAAN